MKHKNNRYDRFCEKLLFLNDEPNLYYRDKEYCISYNEDGWYFTRVADSYSQTFKDGEELIENATIDGKLLSEIFDDVIVVGGCAPSYSEIKIIFSLSGNNIDFDEVTKKMGMQPTKIKKLDSSRDGYVTCEWYYIAFANEEDNVFSVSEKMYKFAKTMECKVEAINMLTKNIDNNHPLRTSLCIVGDPFSKGTEFYLPTNFIMFAHNINTPISFYKDWGHDNF